MHICWKFGGYYWDPETLASWSDKISSVSQLQQRMAALVDEAGYRRDEPIVVGMQHGGRPPILLAQGLTLNGEPLGATTLAYMASLSKQMTAACAAQLAQR